MKFIRLLVLLPLLSIVACAHPIVITPNLGDLSAREFSKIDKVVGYYIAKEDRERSVITPGGGGDKIQYKPYNDLEPALQKVLANTFSDVLTMPAPNDKAFIQSNKISFVFVPLIATDSSSDSAFTWPPTHFSVNLQCKAMDASGRVIWEKNVSETGQATFSEFKNDLPLAAKRAMTKALQALQADIGKAAVFRK